MNTENPELDEKVTQEPVAEIKEEKIPEVKLSKEELELKELQEKRMGKFKVTLSYSDAVYLRNLLDKSEFKGPQQAYILIISKLEISSTCDALKNEDKTKRYDVELSSATIESISYFMNNKTGKGEDAAQRLFAASMLLRQATGEINELDAQLNTLREKQKPKQ